MAIPNPHRDEVRALMRGCLFSQDFARYLFQESPLLQNISLRHARYAPDAVAPLQIQQTRLASMLAVRKLHRAGSAIRPTTVQVGAIIELSSSFLPDASYLGENAAVAYVLATAEALVEDEAFFNVVCNADTRAAFLAAVQAAAFPVVRHADRWVRLWSLICPIIRPGLCVTPIAAFVHAAAGIAKRGQMTEQFADKINQGVQAAHYVGFNFNPELATEFYRLAGGYVTQDNAEMFFEIIGGLIPRDQIRIYNIVTQVAGTGLTNYINIGRVMRLYRDFPWIELAQMIPDDFRRFNDAVQEVGNNRFYGFARDLGPARSSGFKGLSYVAKTLLIRVGHEMTLQRYGGAAGRGFEHLEAINALITRYVEERAARVGAAAANVAEDQATQELLERVRLEDVAVIFG